MSGICRVVRWPSKLTIENIELCLDLSRPGAAIRWMLGSKRSNIVELSGPRVLHPNPIRPSGYLGELTSRPFYIEEERVSLAFGSQPMDQQGTWKYLCYSLAGGFVQMD
jgi:hypothetical protein